MSDVALRKKVEQTHAALDKARDKYRAKGGDKEGRALLKARQAASEALAELYAACPEEKPPTQTIV